MKAHIKKIKPIKKNTESSARILGLGCIPSGDPKLN